MNPEAQAERTLRGLESATLLEMYRHIYAARRIDDKEIQLKRQNRIFFQISGAGHEGVLAAAGPLLKPGSDWFYLYYRDRALCLGLGMSYDAMLLQAVGAAADPAVRRSSDALSLGLYRAQHRLHLESHRDPVPQRRRLRRGRLADGAHPGLEDRGERDEIVLVSSGDGTTSEGEFWESLNTACNLRLPVLYLIEDNGYAISVPVEVQTAGGSISKLVRGFPNLLIEEVDGCDPVASYVTLERAIAWCRQRRGPALVHAKVIRPYSHSLSDDERMYRPDAERDEEGTRPAHDFPPTTRRGGNSHRGRSRGDPRRGRSGGRCGHGTRARVPQPEPETALRFVYSPKVDPTTDEFSTEPRFSGEPTTMVDLPNAAMRDEMERDPRIVVFGEDVADASARASSTKSRARVGLQGHRQPPAALGGVRVFNSPLAEANILGRAGMATRGLKPVVEIQFYDYIWPAYHQIRNELALLRWRSNNDFAAPMVVRVPCGGYLKGGAIYHSQSGVTLFTA